MLVAFLIVINLFASCTLFSHNRQNSRVEATEKPISQNETELEKNERIWRESNIKNYKMTLEARIADALYTTLSPVEIEIRESRAVSIKHLAKDEKSISMEEAKNNFGLMMYERHGINTIEGMFERINQAEAGKTSEGFRTTLIKVEYDSKLGYPVKIDFDRAATDSSLSLQVRKFEIIE